MKKTGGIIVYAVLVLVVLAGTIGGIIYTTNGGTTNARLFDVKLNAVNIDGQVIPISNLSKPLNFNIVPKLGQKLPSGLQVRALPNNEARNIAFTVSGEKHTLSACKDITALFNISKNNDTVSISSDWDLIGFLADYYVVERDAIVFINYIPGAFSFVDLCFMSGNVIIKCALVEYIDVVGVELESDTVIIGG